MKKAQTEILGVAVIVIILVVAGLFMLAMSTKREAASKNFRGAEVSQNFLNSILNTHNTNSITVAQIIQACYSNDCYFGDSPEICCDRAELLLKSALGKTLDEWNIRYHLTVAKGDVIRIKLPPDEQCGRYSDDVHQSFYTIHSPPGFILVTLKTCR
jgi:hypothetical protein